jgi:hypothetical protein
VRYCRSIGRRTGSLSVEAPTMHVPRAALTSSALSRSRGCRRTLGSVWVFALVGMSLPVQAAEAVLDDDSPITPYRPSVSSPAQLPVPGQLEAELGGLRARSADTQRSSLPLTLKLAFSKEWGVVLGTEAQVWQHDKTQGDGHAQGLGDTTVVVKRAWIVDDATAFGMEFGTKLPTANDSIGSGSADYTLNTIFSRDLGPVHMDTNLNATRLGRVDTGSAPTQIGASASFSTPVSERWNITGELSGNRRPGAPSATQLLAAFTYSPSKRLTFDIGMARASHPTPATAQLFAGVVFPIAKLW